MLNEREMSMAKELAQELTSVNRLREKEKLDNAFKTIKSMFEGVKESVSEVWNTLKETFDNICETRKEIEHKNILRQSWHVPIKITLPEAPFVKNYNLQFARNNL